MAPPSQQQQTPEKKTNKRDGPSSDLDNDDDSSGLFDGTPESKNKNGKGTPEAKRQRIDDNINDSASPSKNSNLGSSNTAAADSRRAGLSKFVRRILDPNRKPTGLIEPPSVIPLNDEFLQEFGKREKEFDAKLGRTEEIDHTILDDDDEDDDENDDTATKTANGDNDDAKKDNGKNHTKVKINNLKYTMPAQLLKEECLNFGPVVDVNLIMDDTDPDGIRNSGRAYVTFETEEAAHACVEQQLGGDVDGRAVRVTLADMKPPKRSGGGGAGGGAREEKRYWLEDISTKCFHCGKVGHMGAECPNPAQASICPLCAKADEHDMRNCPLNRVCFNCGLPGHINRECPIPRGAQRQRQICTICCSNFHTRQHCPELQKKTSNMKIAGMNEAICMVCHKKGHFCCQELKFFFGLEGLYCYNCGGKGHLGDQCNRPRLDDLVRSTQLTQRELDRAQEYKL